MGRRTQAPAWLEPAEELAAAIAASAPQTTDFDVEVAARAVVLQHLVLLAASERGLITPPLPNPKDVGPVEYWRAFADAAVSLRQPPHLARLFAASWTDFAMSYDTAQGSFAAAEAGAALEKLAASLESGDSAQPLAPQEWSLTETQIGSCFELLVAQGLTCDVSPAKDKPAKAAKPEGGGARKQSGSFFTPPALAAEVVRSALEVVAAARPSGERALRVLDPALGAGVFLVESCEQLARAALLAACGSPAWTPAEQQVARAKVALESLYGVDANPLAAAVAEACLWLFVGDQGVAICDVGRNLRVGDSLLGFDWPKEFPSVFDSGGFDLVVGNPPWVAFAGRAAQPLSSSARAAYRESFRAFRGYPTLQSLFVERAVKLAPRGAVALLLPSPLADLSGYAAAREAATEFHRPVEPLSEHGQDAFEGVVQPCFTLLLSPAASAAANVSVAAPRTASPAPWQLLEKSRTAHSRKTVAAPAVLGRFADLPTFPSDVFREYGFQSAGEVSQTLFLRATEADDLHTMPLLQGRNVREFHEGAPRLFLRPDRELLRRARCRLRDEADYAKVEFVVRQTAAFPIAALHHGLPFRNSLLAGFACEGLGADLVVGLLNSVLYRSIHLARQRDGRQAVFPQVKVSHLRSLPAPPKDAPLRSQIERLAREATLAAGSDACGVGAELRHRLDDAVFELFATKAEERTEIREFFEARRARPVRGTAPTATNKDVFDCEITTAALDTNDETLK